MRGQLPYLEDHICNKKRIFEKYASDLLDLPASMNPFDNENSKPNFWLSCLLLDTAVGLKPIEILSKLSEFNAEGRPIWKPMHMQPIYKNNQFVTSLNNENHIGHSASNSNEVFSRGLCLPSDNKMSSEQQDLLIEIIQNFIRENFKSV